MKYLGRNTLAMLAIAAFTMVATLAVMGPRDANAAGTDDAKTAETLAKVTPTISTPTLAEDDCDITLKADKEAYSIGDKPVLTVTVSNNGKESVEKTVTVSMLARSLISRGRMPAVARVVWTDKQTVTVEAGKTTELKFEVTEAISANNSMSFNMSGAKDEVSKEARLRDALKRAIQDKDENSAAKPDVVQDPTESTKVEK